MLASASVRASVLVGVRETIVVSFGKKANLVSHLGRLKVDRVKLLLQMVYVSIWSGATKVKIQFSHKMR